jgi:hypothetical protein
MQDLTLRQLDQRTIAIELTVQDQRCMFKGVGRFDERGELGPVLRIEIAHSLGDFEIQLKESKWKGRIESGASFDCDFMLHLDAASVERLTP